jgi:hypothetical protein
MFKHAGKMLIIMQLKYVAMALNKKAFCKDFLVTAVHNPFAGEGRLDFSFLIPTDMINGLTFEETN